MPCACLAHSTRTVSNPQGRPESWAVKTFGPSSCIHSDLPAGLGKRGRAGGRTQGAFNTSPSSTRAAALCFAFRATTNSPITLPERVLACVAETPRPFCGYLCHHFRHDSPVSMASHCGGQSDTEGASLFECVSFLLLLSLHQRPTLTFIRHRRYVKSATGKVTT